MLNIAVIEAIRERLPHRASAPRTYHTTAGAASEAASPANARLAVAILFAGVSINLFDRQVINVVAQSIKAELHISDTGLGLLTGTTFGLFFAAVALPMGWLADRMDRRRLIAAMVVLWSASTMACGVAAGYLMLVLGRIGIGLGEGGAQPASTALVADLASPGRRSSALSLMFVGVPVGTLLGYFVGGQVSELWGWRAAFLVAGAPGFLVALLILAFVRDPRPRAALHRDGTMTAAIMAVIRTRSMGPLAVALSASSFAAYATNAWIPAFFMRVHGMSVAEIGLYGALAVGSSGALGVVAAGPLCDWLRKRTAHPEAWFMVVATGLSIPATLLMVMADDKRLALAGMALLQAPAFAWPAPATRLIQDAAGPTHRALAVAVCSTAASIFTLCLGIPVVGLLSDLMAPMSGARSVGHALCLLAVPVALIGAAAYGHVLVNRQTGAR